MRCFSDKVCALVPMILILALLPQIQSQQVNIFGSKFRQHPRFGETQEERQTDKETSKEDMMIHSVIDIMDEMMTEKDSKPRDDLFVDRNQKASSQPSSVQNHELLKSRLRPLIASVLTDPLSSTSPIETKVSRLKKALSQELDPSIRDHILGNKSFDNHAKNLFMRAARNKVAATATSTRENTVVTTKSNLNNRRVVNLFQRLGMPMPEDASTTIAVRTLAPSVASKLSTPVTTPVTTSSSSVTTTQSRALVLNEGSEKIESVRSAGKKRVRLLKNILQKLPTTQKGSILMEKSGHETSTTSVSRVVGKITTPVSTISASKTAISSLPPPPRKVVLLNSKSLLSGNRRFNLQSTLLEAKTKSKTGSNPVGTNKTEQDEMESKLNAETIKTDVDVESSTQSSVNGLLKKSIPKKVVLLKSILDTVPTNQIPTTRVSTPGVSTTSEPDTTTHSSTAIVSGNISVHKESDNRRVVLLKSFKNLFKPSENIMKINKENNEEFEMNTSNSKSTKTEADSSMLPSEVVPQEPISKKVVLLKSFLLTTPTQVPHTQVSTLPAVSSSSKPETDQTPVPVMTSSSSKPTAPSQNRRIVLLKSFTNLVKSSENKTKLESDIGMSNVEKGKESESDTNEAVTQVIKTEVDNLPGKVSSEETIPKKVVLLKSFLLTTPTQVSTLQVSSSSKPETDQTPVPVMTISGSKPTAPSQNRRIVLLKSFSNLVKSSENKTKFESDTGMSNVEKGKESESDTNEAVTQVLKTKVDNLPGKVSTKETIPKKVVLLKSFLLTTPTQEPHTHVSTLPAVSTSTKPETDKTPVPVMTISSSKPTAPSQNRRIVLLKSFSNLFKSSGNKTKFESDTGMSNVEKGKESESDTDEAVTEVIKTEVDNLPGKVLTEETNSKKVVLLKSFRVTPPTHEPHTRVTTQRIFTESQSDTTTPVPATTVSSSTSEEQSQNRRVGVLKSFANLFKSPGVVDGSSPENMTRLESDDSMSDKEEDKDSEVEISKATNFESESSTQSSIRILPQESIFKKVVLPKSSLLSVSTKVPRKRVSTLDLSTTPQSDATTPVPNVNVPSNTSLIKVKVLSEESISEKIHLLKSVLVTASTHGPRTQVSTVHVSTTSEPGTTIPVHVTTISSTSSEVPSESKRVVFKTVPNLFKVPENMTKVEARDGKLKSGTDFVEASNVNVPSVMLDDVSSHISEEKENKLIHQNSRKAPQSTLPSTQASSSKLKIVPMLSVHHQEEPIKATSKISMGPRILKFLPAVPLGEKLDVGVPPPVPQPESDDILNAVKLAKLHALLNQEHISKITVVTTTTLSPPLSTTTTTVATTSFQAPSTLLPRIITTSKVLTVPTLSTTTKLIRTTTKPLSTNKRVSSLILKKQKIFSALFPVSSVSVLRASAPNIISVLPSTTILPVPPSTIVQSIPTSTNVLPASFSTNKLPASSSTKNLPDLPPTTIQSVPSSTRKLPVSSSTSNLSAPPSTTILPLPVPSSTTDLPAFPTITSRARPLSSTSSATTVSAFTSTTKLVNTPKIRILTLSSSTRSSSPAPRILSKAPPTRAQNTRLPGVVVNKKFKVKLVGPLVQKSVKPSVSTNPGRRFFNKVPYREVVRFLSDQTGGVSLVNTQGHTLAHSKAGHTIPILNQLPAGLAPTLKITPVIISGLGNGGATLGARRRFF